ncbi:MAG: 3-dehydroquinate synthase II family protein [Pseudonocardiales bacterium]|nr:3-dehydroquinate synthase II family protein [Pseudonocardiales bacterium]
MHLAWIDLRQLTDPMPIAEEAIHAGAHGLLADDPQLLGTLPPSVQHVGYVPPGADDATVAELAKNADILIFEHAEFSRRGQQATDRDVEFGVFVTVDDQKSLDTANSWASRATWTVIDFKDPTKIPLEIVLAAADKAEGRVVTVVHDLEEARIVFDVLEKGSDGVLLTPHSVGDATELAGLAHSTTATIEMEELIVTELRHVGLGDRVCVDTCSHLGTDEGILVGSYAHSMVLVSSETHPLPYMPTRPFRVNAGALHSYTLCPNNRTRYLSELESGSEVLAVRTNGQTRRVVVGRAKIESRPLLKIHARSRSGTEVDLIVQDDWHVRVLGPCTEVRNVTELTPGDVLVGLTLSEPRHVGYAVREFLLEK